MSKTIDATKREQCIYGTNVEIVSRTDDCTVYKISDETGEIIMTSYSVFPGINLVYNDVHMQECLIDRAPLGNILEINHCLKGRIECEFRDDFCYLSSGDLAIALKDDAGHGSYFPLKYYQGISVMIDIDKAPKSLSCFLKDVNVCPYEIAKKFCYLNKCYVSRSEPYVEHIFSELYNVPENIKKGYFKIKILELLLFLNGIDVNEEQLNHQSVSKTHAALAKSICKYLTENMDCRITLNQLSDVFHVSGTLIKSSFKEVYGVSIYSYIRTQKMQAAEIMLKETNLTVLDIAGHFGYDNGSKFASAFKNVVGMTPNEYRNT